MSLIPVTLVVLYTLMFQKRCATSWTVFKTSECMFLGYSSISKAYRLWSFDKQCLITSSVLCHSSMEPDLVCLSDLFPFDYILDIAITSVIALID